MKASRKTRQMNTHGFAVHTPTTVFDVTNVATPDEARAIITKKYPKVEITKIKAIRS